MFRPACGDGPWRRRGAEESAYATGGRIGDGPTRETTRQWPRVQQCRSGSTHGHRGDSGDVPRRPVCVRIGWHAPRNHHTPRRRHQPPGREADTRTPMPAIAVTPAQRRSTTTESYSESPPSTPREGDTMAGVYNGHLHRQPNQVRRHPGAASETRRRPGARGGDVAEPRRRLASPVHHSRSGGHPHRVTGGTTVACSCQKEGRRFRLPRGPPPGIAGQSGVTGSVVRCRVEPRWSRRAARRQGARRHGLSRGSSCSRVLSPRCRDIEPRR